MVSAGSNAGVVSVASSSTREGCIPWKEILEPVDPFMKAVSASLAEQVDAFDPEISPYARYALTNQGKQMRPALVALSAGAGGSINESLVTAAVIVEMVHLATLVHDDIMDEAELRRRRPTLAANWGNQISVLLGDCLFAHALKLAAGYPTPEMCRAVAAATNTVCSGEILQTHQRRNFSMTRQDYFRVLEMKTATLFALSCDLGAWLGGASSPARAALRQYGQALGIAYQIYDDCLDLFGRESIAGKSLGTDLAGGKLTLPVLVAFERANRDDAKKLREYIENWNAGNLPWVIQLLEKYDARGESGAALRGYLDHARKLLSLIPDSPSLYALNALTHFLAQQTDTIGVSA